MDDKNFDKLLKKHMQEDKSIPENINQLFSNFESEVNMKENKKSNVITLFKNVSIAACTTIVLTFGGCTYAHINGIETIISPLLRNLGINSKYEENATEFNNEVEKNNIKIKLLDGAMDDTMLIIGSEISVPNITPGAWIEINGEYKINNLNVKPINSTIDRLSDTEFVYYQVFDVSEIKINTKQNIIINANIFEIKEYFEIEDLDSAYKEYGEVYTDNWSFEERIDINNLEDDKKYLFTDSKKYKTDDNIEMSVTKLITGSYSNILIIKTDKTDYQGDDFEKYYKVLDEQRNEIASFGEEKKEYDHRVYNNRLVLGNIDKKSKIYVEVYLRKMDEERFNKVLEIPVNLADAIEEKEEEFDSEEYKTDSYIIKYNKNWNLIPTVDTNKVGPNSIYLGALELEIPSTTNSEYTSSMYVKVTDEDTTIDELSRKIIQDNEESVSEYYEEKSSSEISLKNQKGYTIVSETTDGEDDYIKQDTFAVANGKVYRIIFFGNEKEYNNLTDELNRFFENFEVLD